MAREITGQIREELIRPNRFTTLGLNIAPFFALLLIWYVLSASGVFPQLHLPGPKLVFQAGLHELRSGILINDLLMSLGRLFAGFAIGALLGVYLGLAMGKNRYVAMCFDPLANFFQAIGGIAWVPLAVLWFGFGWGSILFVIFNTVFFVVLFNTLTGVEAIPRNLINSALTLGATQRTIMLEIFLPGALPNIVTGIRLGMAFGWRALIAAEMIAASSGVGFRIYDGAAYWKSEEIIFGLIVIGTVWIITDKLLLRPLEQKTIERWGTVRVGGK